ncbi:MAG: Fmu (Sun) domain-containing protein, partial [Desulfohalobiaceae bacterium]|nr:Fmu (Sun) domain-containing protein [Desulfohalobiaceae bacterium]
MIKKTPRPGQNGRLLALRVAFKTQHSRDLQAGLNRELAATRSWPDRERRLATELVYGYARFKGRIDWILSSFLKKGSNKLPTQFWTTLGQGVYELLFLDRVPDYAAVDFYVHQAGKRWGKNLSGLGNALLRRVVRERSTLHDKAFYQADRPDRDTFFSRYYSCPGWMVRILTRSLGLEAAEIVLKHTLKPPLVGIRINQQASGSHELMDQLARLPEAALCRPP